jgi:hypothetical protein
MVNFFNNDNLTTPTNRNIIPEKYLKDCNLYEINSFYGIEEIRCNYIKKIGDMIGFYVRTDDEDILIKCINVNKINVIELKELL